MRLKSLKHLQFVLFVLGIQELKVSVCMGYHKRKVNSEAGSYFKEELM